jgi:hypothetical protein
MSFERAAVGWLVRYVREVKGVSSSDCQQAVTTLNAIHREAAALESLLIGRRRFRNRISRRMPMPPPRRPRTEIKLPPGSLAEMYLSRAVEEFHRTGDPPDLWTEPDPFLADSIVFSGERALMTAQNNRLQALRTSVLFAAITVEAFANEFATEALGAKTAEMVDNLSPADKVETALRLATGDDTILDRGRDPMQMVVQLIKIRNRLVHPKPSKGPAAWTQAVEESDEKAIGPQAAERAILQVANLIVLCAPHLPYPNLRGGLAKMIVQNEDLLTTHREAVGPGIRDLPGKDAPGTSSIYNQMLGRIKPAATGLEGAGQAGSDSGIKE